MSTSPHQFLEGVRNLHHPGGLTVSLKPSKLSNLPIEDILTLRFMLIMFNTLSIGILLNLKSVQHRFLMRNP